MNDTLSDIHSSSMKRQCAKCGRVINVDKACACYRNNKEYIEYREGNVVYREYKDRYKEKTEDNTWNF